MPDWNSEPPKLGSPLNVPWNGPYYPDDAAPGHTPSPPSDVFIALKRTLGHLGAWPWDPDSYDRNFGDGFSHGSSRGPGVAGVQRWAGIQNTGWIGKATWDFLTRVLIQPWKDHAGEHALDAYSCDLIRKAADPPPTPDEQIEQIQREMQDYCRRSLANAANWHYQQYRPMRSLGLNPDGVIYSDCSEGATAIYYWARQQTGLDVPDPNGNGYDGTGYTETLWDNNDNTGAPYRVGDMALYTSNGGHVTVCMQGGSDVTSLWWSNGSEGGPYQESLRYRTDLRGVVRPVLLG